MGWYSFGLFGPAAGAVRPEPPRSTLFGVGLLGGYNMGGADGGRGGVTRGRKFP